jgi:hypothetical protein
MFRSASVVCLPLMSLSRILIKNLSAFGFSGSRLSFL